MSTIDLSRAIADAPQAIPHSLFGLPDEPPHERVLLAADDASGLRAIIAVHSTARGPGFGGCRVWTYPHELAGLRDALRLSQGMSLKNALANLPFGGGKAVILKPAGTFDRAALFAAFGRAVESLDGVYITAEDVGTTTADMRAVQSQTRHVSGIPRDDGSFGGDPSPMTALGVFVAIEAGVKAKLGRSLDGVVVAVQGLGSVGFHLAQLLAGAGAKLLVADVNEERVQRAVQQLGARAVGVDEILTQPCEVLAPCALGAVITASNVGALRTRIVAGAANNQLATPAEGDALAARDILYLPDYLINAGGIISVAREHRREATAEGVKAEVEQISGRVTELLARIKASGRTPGREADAWARSLLVRPA